MPNDKPAATPPAGGPIVTIETPPPQASPTQAETAAELAALQERMDTLNTTLTEGIAGERTWTTQQLTSLQQELADLKATLAEVATNLPAQMKIIRDELTLQLREARQKLEAQEPQLIQVVKQEEPPNKPPVQAEPPKKENEEDHDLPPKPQARTRRVV